MSFEDNAIYWVEVDKIVPNPYQPRREFNEESLKELGDSIRMYGVLQPLTVTRKEIQGDDGSFRTEYELIAGERRLRASKLAGVEQVPVLIRTNEDTEQEKLELAIIENVQREDLNAVDRALAFQQLAETFDLSHVQVAKKVGRSREYVSNSIRLLLLPNYMLQSLKNGDISEGHARALLMLKERPEEQDVVFREILLKKLSVREVERISRKIATDKVRKKTWKDTDPVLIEIERELTDSLGTRVQIQKTDFGGKLTIDYFSESDLQRLLLLVKDKGKLSEMMAEVSGNEVEGEESDEVLVKKLVDATPLAAGATTLTDSTEENNPVPTQEPETVSPVQDENVSNNPVINSDAGIVKDMPAEELVDTAVENAQISSRAIEEAVIDHAVSYTETETPADMSTGMSQDNENAEKSEESVGGNIYENLDNAIRESVPQEPVADTAPVVETPHHNQSLDNAYKTLDQAIGAEVSSVEDYRPLPEDVATTSASNPVNQNTQASIPPVPKPPMMESEVSVSQPATESAPEQVEVPQDDAKKKDDDESGLYSMNNFSL